MEKKAFVTGGTGGIGKEIVKTLSQNGYAVTFSYNKNLEQAKQIALQFNADFVKLDITDSNDINNLKDLFEKQNFSLLVNNAGVAHLGLFQLMSDEQLMYILNSNLIGAVKLTKLILPFMIRNQKGNIINISSMWGEVGASCEVAYSCAKAGLIGFTKALAKEVAPSGIRVNCISAGAVDTKMNDCLSKEEKESFCQEIPLGRFASPKEIADAALFLASEKSSYITGEILRVNGGFVC